MVKELERAAPPLRRGAAPASAWAFQDGRYLPIGEAKVSVMTHAFNYGTGVFEGIRAYWNERGGELYALHLREHFSRLQRSCRIMRISLPHSVDELCGIALEVLRRSGYREDAYLRPIAYKKSELIGVRLHDLEDAFTLFAIPFGDYLPTDRMIHCTVSSWRRTDDNAIPARAKVTGSYVNAALAKSEAAESGFDEAIVLNADGHVSEGSAENLFMVRDGVLVTTPGTDNILEGIVRGSVMRIARDLGIAVEVRPIDRTELYIADEAFLCGTGTQINAIASVDHRPVGTGETGPLTSRIREVYFRAVRGDDARYREWVTPVYGSQ